MNPIRSLERFKFGAISFPCYCLLVHVYARSNGMHHSMRFAIVYATSRTSYSLTNGTSRMAFCVTNTGTTSIEKSFSHPVLG